jgi:Cu-processing system permease protein
MVLGVIYYYNSREFAELLLAQPIKRKSVFLGQYLGLSMSLCLSFLLGIGLPFVVYGIFISGEVWNFAMLVLVGILLTMIFVALSFLIASYFENKIKGFGIAIIVWLTLAVIYDGLLLLAMVLFEDYPLEKASLAATLFNPIDLSRILIMLKLDISSLMGYTGALFQKFFGSIWGITIVIGSLIVWVLVPVLWFERVVRNKDI